MMSVERTEGRRTNHRAFRPTLDGALEPRLVLSRSVTKIPFPLHHPKIGVAWHLQQPPFLSQNAPPFKFQAPQDKVGVNIATAHGGQTAKVATPNGVFTIQLTQFLPTTASGTTSATTGQNPIQNQVPGAQGVQPIGTVRAYPMAGGKIGIIVDGTTTQSELDISPVGFPQRKGYAHSFAYAQAAQSHILNIGQITVNTGQLSAINGFHTADLSGPVVVSSDQPVDRISFNALLPGASITTGGDLNTLDVLQGITLNSGPGIVIGRDLNLLNVGTNIDLSNGASIRIGRYLGLQAQPAKGTGNGSNFLALNQTLLGTNSAAVLPGLAGNVQGSFNLGAGSTFTVNSGIPNTSIQTATGTGGTVTSSEAFLVNGQVTAQSLGQFAIPGVSISNSFTPNVNFVVRNGIIFNGTQVLPPST
jgi:hypothetical protein